LDKTEPAIPSIVKTLFDEFFDHLQEAVALTDKVMSILQVNRAFVKMFGYSPEEILGENIDSIVVSDGAIRDEARQFSAATASGNSVLADTVRKRKDGTFFPVTLHAIPFSSGGNGRFNFVIYRHRVVEMPEALGRDELFGVTLLEHSPNPIFVINPDTSIRYVNRAFEKLTGYGLGDLAGAVAPYPWWTRDSRVSNMERLLGSFQRGADKEEYLFSRRDGSPFRVEATGVPVRSGGVFQYFLSNWVDITERKDLEEKLGVMARHDQLTGLYNRHFFNEFIEKELRRSHRFDHPVAFLMIDIDGFKKINDTFGHNVGDTILREVADLLSGMVRDIDSVIRYGGDEFLVVLVETNGEKEIVRQRILAEVERRKPGMDSLGYPVTLSIGGSHLEPGEGDKMEAVLAEADREMYRDKEGKNK
jgi:diguanylate cyclase (GGDEF)-like protein/PAS domain S-box-containing protein